jgi:serine/threonine-protein kinase
MDPQQGYPQQDLIVGQTIGNYLVTQKLGEGGMGAVYLAEHPGIGKKVALKVLHSEFSSNEDVAARFFNEAKAVNNIGHPNIVDIIDYGMIQAGGGREQLVYFIMEYLSGLTLSQLIRNESPLPPERSLGIALQVADALSASHKCGIVHRDLKPDNIMLQQRGRERDFVKLLDFGIAKLTSNAAGSRRTRTGIVMGTPAYMSPEQCDGRGMVDHRTDIYALGIVLYEMLAGRVPFIGEGYGEILVQHLTQPPIAPSQFRMINPHVEAVVMKALEKRMELRLPDMDEMMRALADPIGYVEAHGGIAGFGQRQLMPSNVPFTATPTPSRLSTPTTPPPMTTPLPGSVTPMGGYTPTPPPGQYQHNAAAAAPTTLGGAAGAATATGEVRRGKLGFVLAALAVVAAAIVAIVVVTKNSGETAGAGSEEDGSSTESGSELAVAPDSGPEIKVASGSNPGSATPQGSNTVTPGSASTVGSGSNKVETPPKVEPPKVVTITLTTKPAGAKILVNGFEIDQVTPQPFEIPIGTKAVTISLRLEGYKDITLDKFVPNQNVNAERTFVKKRTTPVPVSGRGSGKGSAGKGSAGKGSSSGTGNDTGLIRPGD